MAGGGQPTYLITNYAFTMMMLFYLMIRDDPIVPSVAYLRAELGSNCRDTVVIDGWSCSFSGNIEAWCCRRHNVLIMELVADFFNFFGNFEASKWIISPLAGELLSKEPVRDRDQVQLPRCMTRYCTQSTDIQLNTALCVQDPFENSHNCTRGLRDGPLAEFQYKCRKAAEICEDILKGLKTLSDFLEVIEITPEILKEICKGEPPKEAAKELEDPQGEVITLDDSDNSQDSIEVLTPEKRYKAPVELINVEITNLSDDDIVEIPDGDSQETLDKTMKSGSATEVAENGISKQSVDGNGPLLLPETVPERKIYKFPLSFSQIPEFSISFDGALAGGKGLLTGEDDIGQVACALVQFSLQQCLKVDISVIDEFMGDKKRKALTNDDTGETSKRIKATDGESVPVVKKYRRLAQYQCVAVTQLWVGRKKISKMVPMKKNINPLQHEMAITEVQLETTDEYACWTTVSDDDEKLDFIVEVWQKCTSSTSILVTGDSKSNVKVTRAQMIPMFTYLSSLSQNLLKKVTHFVNTTSTKR